MSIKKNGFIVFIVLMMLLSACSTQNPKESTDGKNAKETTGAINQINLTMLSSWSSDVERGKALKNLVEQFNQKFTGQINVKLDINPDWPALQEKTKTMISANETPDLFNYNFNPNDLSRQNSGKLLDFTPYMDNEWKSRFNEEDLKSMTINGQLNSIPFEKAGALFYYNKDLFAKAEVSTFPTTWDEFFQICEKLKKAGIIPISLMTSDDAWHTTNALSYLAADLGGANVFDRGKSLNTPEMIKAAEYLQKLFAYSTNDALGANYAVSSNNFLTGKTAMIIDGPWMIGSINESMVNSIGVAPSPSFGDGKVKPGFIVTDANTPWSAAKQESKDKEKAEAEFIKFMTSESSVKQFTIEGRILMSPKIQISADELKQSGPILGQFIQVNSQALESMVQISRVLKPVAISKIPSLIEGLILKKYTPQQFAEKLQEANK